MINKQKISIINKTHPILLNFNKFRELDRFRKEETSHTYKLYPASVKKVKIYQFLFISLGTLFAFLEAILYSHHSNWAFEYVFLNALGMKNLIMSLTLFFAFTCLTLALSLCPAKEAARQIESRILLKLNRLLAKKRAELNAPLFSSKALALNAAAKETRFKMREKRLAAEMVLSKIMKAEIQQREKETLIKQALLELNEKLKSTVGSFSS